MVTPEDESADIAAVIKRGPLFDPKHKTRIMREYTDFNISVAKQYAAFEHSGHYAKWPLQVLKLAYPDPEEKLSPASAGAMMHHLLLLQHMHPRASSPQ